MVMVIYIDGQNRDGTEHYSNKIGEFIQMDSGFVELLSNKKKVMIPINRIIRIEEDVASKMEKLEKKHKWRF